MNSRPVAQWPTPSPALQFSTVGAWRSLVAHLLWEQRVGGSNPLAPTNNTNGYSLLRDERELSEKPHFAVKC